MSDVPTTVAAVVSGLSTLILAIARARAKRDHASCAWRYNVLTRRISEAEERLKENSIEIDELQAEQSELSKTVRRMHKVVARLEAAEESTT